MGNNRTLFIRQYQKWNVNCNLFTDNFKSLMNSVYSLYHSIFIQLVTPPPLGLLFFHCIIHIYTMLYVQVTLYFWYQTCCQTSIRRKMTYIYNFMLQDVENIYTQQLWTITKIDKYWKRVSVFRWEYCMAQWTDSAAVGPVHYSY